MENQAQEIPDFIKLAIKFILIALIAGVLLAFNPWGYNLFIVPKLYLLINLTSLLLILSLVFLALGGKIGLPLNRITATLIIFFVLIVISTLNSVLPRISLIGKMPRYEGLLTWFFYIVLFFVGYSFIYKDSDRKHIYWTLALTTLIISVYGILQALGFDIIKWRPGLAAGRIRSTLGNPATLGAYLSLALPFISSRLLQKMNIKSRLLILAVLLSGIAALFMTGSRGAWLGFIIAAAFLFFKLQTGNRKKLLAAVALTLLFFAFMFTLLKLESKRGTAQGRLILWKQTSKAVIDKPLLGWGPDTFQYIFPNYISKQYEQRVTRKTIIDNAHNLFLHNSVSSGLFSTVVLMLFLLMVFLKTYKAVNKDTNSGLFLSGILAGAIGYVVSLQFHFSTVAVSSVFWILLGVGLRASQEDDISNNNFSDKKRYYLIPVFASMVIFWTLASVLSAKALLADMELKKGLVKSAQGQLAEASLRLFQAQNLQPLEEYYPLTAGQVLLQMAEMSQSISLIDEAGVAFDRALKLNPLDEYAILGLADVQYLKWEINKNRKNLAKSKDLYQQIINSDPNFTDVKKKLKIVSELLKNN